MKAEEIAKWCIDNRFKALKESNFEMYTSIVDMINEYAKDQIEKDRERVKAKLIRLDVGEFIIESAFERTPIILD